MPIIANLGLVLMTIMTLAILIGAIILTIDDIIQR